MTRGPLGQIQNDGSGNSRLCSPGTTALKADGVDYRCLSGPRDYLLKELMENALITLSIGLSEAERVSHEIFRAYAEKHQLAFEVISEPKFRIQPNWFRKRRVWYHIEKFQLFEALERYNRVLFLDSDILLDVDCPNLFEQVPEGSLGCVYDDRGAEAWKRKAELERISRKLGKFEVEGYRYFNSGVMVLDSSLKSLFRMDRKAFIRGRWPEQTLLNYRVLKEGVPVHELDDQFNFLPNMDDWERPEKRHAAKIVHYASQEAKSRMQEDLHEKLSGWGLSGKTEI